MSTTCELVDRRVRVSLGVTLSPDAWRIMKRLHDLTGVTQIEVHAMGHSPFFIRPADLDLCGVSSAAFATERDALYALALRVPGLRVKRSPMAEPMALGEIFRVPSSLVPPPLSNPKTFEGHEVPANSVEVAPSVNASLVPACLDGAIARDSAPANAQV